MKAPNKKQGNLRLITVIYRVIICFSIYIIDRVFQSIGRDIMELRLMRSTFCVVISSKSITFCCFMYQHFEPSSVVHHEEFRCVKK